VDDQAVLALLQVADVEGDQLAAAGAGGEAQQEEGPVPGLGQRGGPAQPDQAAQVLGTCGSQLF
jgi:hypothetical protein